MRKYYLFSIRKEYYEIYYKNPLVLYKTLENLYYLKKDNLSFGLSVYKQICNTINISRLKVYFDDVCIEKTRNKYLVQYNKEYMIFDLHYSCIICRTIKNYPFGLKIINYYDKNIFVCDFENRDYFFLDGTGLNRRKNKYNYS